MDEDYEDELHQSWEDAEHGEDIKLSADEYLALRDSAIWLECLLAAGVDHWEGYSYAQEIMEEYNKQHTKVLH